jgi:hypothetical protein
VPQDERIRCGIAHDDLRRLGVGQVALLVR